MRSVRRAVTAVAAAAALTVAGAGLATPAHADPSNGEGCVGLPSVPLTYVCVISVTPLNAVPTVTTTNIPVNVPQLCYFLDCTDPTTVNVPVPGVAEGSGQVAVVYHDGVYYPIGIGTGGLVATVNDVVDLGRGIAQDGLATVLSVVDLALGIAGPVIDDAAGTVDTYASRVNNALDELNYINEYGACYTAIHMARDLTRKNLSTSVCDNTAVN